jgi:hypothetical protein
MSFGKQAKTVTRLNHDCDRSGTLRGEQLSLPTEKHFPITESKLRFRCQACGSRAVDLMPDWSGYRGEGMGRSLPSQ